MKLVIENFYSSFSILDAESMIAYYHDDIVFEDPAFGVLKGDKAKNMWRMLCANAKDLEIKYSKIDANSDNGKAHWEAHYTFSQTGKRVHNIIDASFEFKNGRIIKHTENFNLHKWAKQALGFQGLLLGGTSFFKKKLNAQTNKLLSAFEQKT